MASIVRLSTRREIDELASLWLSRLDRGLLETERQELVAWLAADSRHTTAMIDLARAWDSMESLRALAPLVDLRQLQDRRTVRRQRRLAMGGLLSAGLAVFLVTRWDGTPQSGSVITKARNDQIQATASIASGSWTTTLSTERGQRQVASLPDGSRVTLNTATTVLASSGSGIRRVDLLKGEATFEVAHDANQPFVVVVGQQRVRAVGTVFNVRRRDDDSFSVLVTEGRVAVEASSTRRLAAPQLLSAGERLDAGLGSVEIRSVSTSDVTDTLAWHDGMIVFEGEPLAAAIAEVSRYSNARFVIEDQALRMARVAGVYRTNDLQGFIESLRANFDLIAEHDPDGTIRLSSKRKDVEGAHLGSE